LVTLLITKGILIWEVLWQNPMKNNRFYVRMEEQFSILIKFRNVTVYFAKCRLVEKLRTEQSKRRKGKRCNQIGYSFGTTKQILSPF